MVWRSLWDRAFKWIYLFRFKPPLLNSCVRNVLQLETFKQSLRFYNMIAMAYSIAWWGLLFHITLKSARCKTKSAVKTSTKLSLYVFFKLFVLIFCSNGRRNSEVLLLRCASFEALVWLTGFTPALWRNAVVLATAWGISRETSRLVCRAIICGKIYLGVSRGRGIGLSPVPLDAFVRLQIGILEDL